MILVSGSIAYDTIISTVGEFDNNRRESQNNYSYSLYAPHVVRQPGGTGHNIAYNLGILWYKNQTILTGSVGSDFVIDERLEKYINYTHVVKDEHKLTAGAYITNDEANNQIIAFHPWAMSSGLYTIPDQKFDYAIIAPDDKAIMISHTKLAKQSGALVFFDPGQALWLFTKEELSDIFHSLDYLICNDEEAATIAKLFDTTEDQLTTFCAGVIITRGAQGVSFYPSLSRHNPFATTHHRIDIPVYPTDHVVDPTGAGDALRGGMFAWLLQGKSLEVSLWYGCIMWSLTVSHQGTMNHHITMEELENKYKLWIGE